jgi:hypothetical protein
MEGGGGAGGGASTGIRLVKQWQLQLHLSRARLEFP